jgi:molybdopterin molybdotransferase
MVQLADDCFAFGGPLLPVAEARALLAARVVAVAEAERVALAAASGRVLAEDLVAPLAVPPHDNSAVDGYALRHADLAAAGDTRLPVGGRAAAGHPLGRPLRAGEAIRIFTGAPMPAGADTVMMQEDCRAEGDHVVLRPGLKPGANRRRAGEDIQAGATVLAAGRRLRPVDVGLAASLGLTQLAVRRPLRAALFSTGDEIAEPGRPLPAGALYDANRFSVAALLRAQGVAVTDLGILPDRRAAIATALAGAAAAHDLIVTTGGVSEGEEDHVKAAVTQQGQLHLWRLAIKPGRPVALGQVGRTAFVGLPGNPAAAVVTFVALVRPLLQLLAGERPREPLSFPVEAGFAYRKKADRQEWLRVFLERAADGRWQARKFPREGAGILTSLSETDGFAPLAEAVTEVRPGDRLDFIPYSEVLA